MNARNEKEKLPRKWWVHSLKHVFDSRWEHLPRQLLIMGGHSSQSKAEEKETETMVLLIYLSGFSNNTLWNGVWIGYGQLPECFCKDGWPKRIAPRSIQWPTKCPLAAWQNHRNLPRKGRSCCSLSRPVNKLIHLDVAWRKWSLLWSNHDEHC